MDRRRGDAVKLLLVHSDGTKRKGVLPANQDALSADFDGECPHCAVAPLKVYGAGRRVSADDRAYEADSVSLCCFKFVGVIRLETNTLFGVREDEAVLRGRCRVY
jgi:hypothetical protein